MPSRRELEHGREVIRSKRGESHAVRRVHDESARSLLHDARNNKHSLVGSELESVQTGELYEVR